MAIVMRAMILCDTDDVMEAKEAVSRALNAECFLTDSPVLDFAIGFEQGIALPKDYVDGSFVRQVPAAALMETANSVSLPI